MVCSDKIPDSRERRRLRGGSCREVYEVYEVVTGLSPDAVLPANSYVCRKCFRSVEKLIKLRKDAGSLEQELKTKLSKSSEFIIILLY